MLTTKLVDLCADDRRAWKRAGCEKGHWVLRMKLPRYGSDDMLKDTSAKMEGRQHRYC
jgi:hypothetical protein